MSFDFEAFKKKYINQSESKIFVGNVDEIRNFIAAYEETQTALEVMSKELKKANERIKESVKALNNIRNNVWDLNNQNAVTAANVLEKARYMDLDD